MSILNQKFLFFINDPIHFDYDHFIEDVESDNYYNQFLFQKMINFLDKKKNIKIVYGAKYEFSTKKKKLKKNLIYLIFYFQK